MAAADVRDMLDLPAEGQPRPHKKQKVAERRPEGVPRELYALLGERAPPIAITENRYKGRPKWISKSRVRPWRMVPFTNGARSDGLVLRHWQRVEEPVKTSMPEGTDMNEDEKKELEAKLNSPEQEYPFAKYNVKARVPRRYTDEEYNKHLRSDHWTREETDYLMDIVQEYDLRWVVIADRYDYQSQPIDAEANTTALVPASKRHRTMEQMKSRFYYVAATMLALEHPPSEMSETEFDLHEKMMKFDPDRERARKELSALQLNRTADEVREEGILLEELKRITANEQNFITERRELYARLEVPISVGNTTMYQSSQGLGQLLQSLLQTDRSKKRRSLLGPEGAQSPAVQTPVQGHHGRDSLTDTPSAAPATSTKKSAAAAAAAAAAANKDNQHPVKTLTPAEEAKYGVQHHDRLAPGVQFRSERAQKMTQAKSNVQTQKLASALSELEVPLRLVMPTETVCKEFEKLIHSVNLLLDTRKVSEKVESEIKVLEAVREERERKTKEAKEKKDTPEIKTEAQDKPASPVPSGAAVPEATMVDDSQGPANNNAGTSVENKSAGASTETTQDASATAATGNADRDAAPLTPAGDKDGSGQTHKRSASVMSGMSDKSAKRQKR